MIKSWNTSASRQFFETGKSKFSGLDVTKAQTCLAQLHAAAALSDLSPLKSLGLQKLKGERRKFWAINISGPWRIVFRFENGDAYDVEIVDFH